MVLLFLLFFGSSVYADETIINYAEVEEASICEEDLPFRWRNKNYDKKGTYRDTVITTSYKYVDEERIKVITKDIYTLKLATFKFKIGNQRVDICDECSYVYRGKKYDKPGVYDDTITLAGCDSIFRLTIKWATGYHYFDTAHSCVGKTYRWRGKDFTEYGDYLDEFKTQDGEMDSIYHLHLIMHDPVEEYDTVTICATEAPYYWKNNRRDRSGDYTVRQKTKYGCDSISHLHLTILPLPEPVRETHFFCENEGVITHGLKVQIDTTFYDTISAVNGCDSIRIIHYSPYPVSLIEEVVQHFKGEEITWHGRQFKNDTIYLDTIPGGNRYGCDSIYQLRLVTKYDISRTVNSCEGNIVRHGSFIVTSDTVITDTLQTRQRADSIVHTKYHFQKPFFHTEKRQLCENTEIPWPGHEHITLWAHADGEPNKFYDSLMTAGGCDSVYEIEVIGLKAYQNETLVIWCNDTLDKYGEFVWRGHRISSHDVDTVICDTLNKTGSICDSIECLHLIITDRCSPLETIYLCEGTSKTIDGKTYTQPGLYSNAMPSSRNLNVPDSLHRFEIKIAYPTETQIQEVKCESEFPFNWYGQHIVRGGDYETHMQTRYGCDSLVKMHLIMVPTVYSDEIIWHYCTGEDKTVELPSGKIVSPATGEGHVNDTVPHTTSYIDMDGHRQEMLCDSVIRYHFIGHESYFYNDTIYIPTGGKHIWHRNGQPIELTEEKIYWDSCKTTIWGCDSIYRLDLRIAEDWYYKDTAYVCQNELPHRWRGMDCYEAKVYTDRIKGHHGNDSIYERQLFIYPSYQKDTIPVNICQETEYAINGKVIPISAGTRDFYFNDTLKTTYTGCDSVIVYHIRRTSKTIINQGYGYTVHGTPYSWEPVPGKIILCETLGSYFDTVRSLITGCDSLIYTIEVKEEQPFHDTTRVSVCQSELPYIWQGRPFRKDTIQDDVYKTANLRLDSVYRLELTVKPTYYTYETQYICKGEGVNFKGEYITIPGLYYDSILSTNHCDSIHVLNLVQSPSYFFPETLTYVSERELPIEWHGQSLPGVGIYYDSLLTTGVHPCDSVYQVEVIKKESYLFERYESICEGEYVEFFGTKYYESGTYTKPYKTIHNVDSVYVLHLKVNEIKTTTIPVYLCEGESFVFIDTVLSKPTIYRDTLINPDTKCDSIFEVVVNWYNNSETVVNHVLCEGEKLEINGEDVTRKGIYYETLKALYSGCDSVIKHIITVGKPYYHEESHVIRKGDSFPWHQCGTPIVVSEPKVYWDSCYTMLGCDSVMKLTLEYAKDVVFPTHYDTVCYTDLPYIWNTYPISKAISTEGFHYDTCLGNGADTIRSLHLTIIPTKRTSVTLSFCNGEGHSINGIRYTEDAVVVDTLPGKHGCDSIVTYHLKFYPRYEETKTVKLTKAQPFIEIKGALNVVGGDTILRTKGIYQFRYKSIHDCDSLVTLVVDECQTPILNVVPYNMCKGDAIYINGRRISQSGSYDFWFSAEDGCDSIVRYVVKENQAYEFTETATMCRNSSYTWSGHHHDTVYTHQGTFYDSLKTTLGCDSVFILKLSYKRTDLSDTIVSICESDLPYRYKGQLYFEEKIFYDTLANNTEGCDSVLRWTYKVNTHCSDYVHYNRCIGHYMTIDGIVISEQGTYVQHHLTEDGQDSLYRFTVHDVPNYEFTTILTGCDSIVYDGRTYYARGLGQESFNIDLDHRTAEGCDSLEHLQMTINMSSPTHVYSKTIADYDSVRFGPYFHNTTGSFEMHYTNQHGCDSTEILNLTVLPTQYVDMVHYFICQGDPRGIEVFGTLYHPTVEYTYIADTTWLAGQPVIRTADIVVQKPFTVSRFYPDEDQIVCSDFETSFPVRFATVDPLIVPDYYSVDFHAGELEGYPLHQEGALNGKNSIDIFMTGRGKYITPGYYRYSVTLRSESCVVSDTTLEGSVLVRYPSDVMEVSWNDAVMLVNEKYNGGGWKFKPPYVWTIHSSQGLDKTASVFNDATQPYIYSSSLAEGDRVSALLYREGYDQPVPTCELIFVPKYPVLPHGILVYPSAVRSRMPVTISSAKAGQFRLMDQTGRTYTTGSFQSGETSVLMPGTPGCYIMVMEDEDGEHNTQKMIVY